MPGVVRTKLENYRLWTSGALGNRLRSWRSLASWRRSGFEGAVALRYLGVGGGRCTYDLASTDVEAEAARWVAAGVDPNLMMLNEMAPDDALLVQGEYFAGAYGVSTTGEPVVEPFYHSFEKAPMRVALARSNATSTGLRSRLILRYLMSPDSYDEFEALADCYPSHVIEVSVYGRFIGDIPNRNALVWEVRSY